MSKPVKNMIVHSYQNRFEGQTGGVVICLRGVDANSNNAIRGSLPKRR